MFTMEELHFGPDGRMHTRGPGTYKIPTVGDIPMVFNVALLKGSSNSRVIYSSKVRATTAMSTITVLLSSQY